LKCNRRKKEKYRSSFRLSRQKRKSLSGFRQQQGDKGKRSRPRLRPGFFI
jgi:hypothetical protein